MSPFIPRSTPRFLATLLVEGALVFVVIGFTAAALFPDVFATALPWGQLAWLTAVFALSIQLNNAMSSPTYTRSAPAQSQRTGASPAG